MSEVQEGMARKFGVMFLLWGLIFIILGLNYLFSGYQTWVFEENNPSETLTGTVVGYHTISGWKKGDSYAAVFEYLSQGVRGEFVSPVGSSHGKSEYPMDSRWDLIFFAGELSTMRLANHGYYKHIIGGVMLFFSLIFSLVGLFLCISQEKRQNIIQGKLWVSCLFLVVGLGFVPLSFLWGNQVLMRYSCLIAGIFVSAMGIKLLFSALSP